MNWRKFNLNRLFPGFNPALVEEVLLAFELLDNQGYPVIASNIRVCLDDRGIDHSAVEDATLNAIVTRWFTLNGLGPNTRLGDIPDYDPKPENN
jgi:hypothetical protein